MSLADLFRDELAREFQQRLTRPSDQAAEKTNDYVQKLESATGADLFKYFRLINVGRDRSLTVVAACAAGRSRRA